MKKKWKMEMTLKTMLERRSIKLTGIPSPKGNGIYGSNGSSNWIVPFMMFTNSQL